MRSDTDPGDRVAEDQVRRLFCSSSKKEKEEKHAALDDVTNAGLVSLPSCTFFSLLPAPVSYHRAARSSRRTSIHCGTTGSRSNSMRQWVEPANKVS